MIEKELKKKEKLGLETRASGTLSQGGAAGIIL